MDITKLELGDVTDELILQHYDLEVERKSKNKKTTGYIDELCGLEGEIFDFLVQIQEGYDKVIANLEIPNGYTIAEAVLCIVQYYDSTELEVRVKFSRLETDEEVLQRLFNGVRRNIRRYKKSLKTVDRAKDEERKLYEELKKKYEN